MQKKLFPEHFVYYTIEHYTFRIKRSSKAIYLVLVLTTTGILVALPFVYTSVRIQARGQLNTIRQIYQLNTPVGDFLLQQQIKEGNKVSQGDTLLLLDNRELRFEIDQISGRLEELQSFQRDLELLISWKSYTTPLKLQTARYNLAYQQFFSTMQKQKLEINHLKTIKDRQQQLFDQRVITQAEMEKDDVAYANALEEQRLLLSQNQNQWKTETLDIKQGQRILASTSSTP